MAKFKILFIYIIVVGVVVGLGFWLFAASNKPQNPSDQPGQTFDNQGQTHITEGSTNHPAYNSNPPTSGWHWPTPAAWGVYPNGQPDERLVHNLEHGGIWISYQPGKVDATTVSMLNDFANRFSKIIVEPRAADTSTIALAAWTHSENLDSYDQTKILDFIKAYYDQGPEKVP